MGHYPEPRVIYGLSDSGCRVRVSGPSVTHRKIKSLRRTEEMPLNDLSGPLGLSEASDEVDTFEMPARLVVVGASAGGVGAVSRLVASLPQDFDAALLV